jgi:hypothetical protein
MFWRNLLRVLPAIAVLLGLNLAVAEQAEAKRRVCEFAAFQFTPTHDRLFHKTAKAIKKSWACNRARRRCNRKLERMRRRGEIGRAACVRWR